MAALLLDLPHRPLLAGNGGAAARPDQGRWRGKLLHPGEFVICADEKPSIQARARIQRTLRPASRPRGQRVGLSYQRRGALTSLAALSIGRRGRRRPRAFGRCERRGGIDSCDRLVSQVISEEPLRLRPPRLLDRRQRLLPPRPRRTD
jgi:hypothetical protein